MKIYILRPIEGIANDPWSPWYDKAFGVVVRAENAKEARKMASEKHGDERAYPWLSSEFTTCRQLKPEGKAVVIMVDFAGA